ncbi:MAG: hypothetical protein ABI867_31975, partial [Kofleriaceae bacterium]
MRTLVFVSVVAAAACGGSGGDDDDGPAFQSEHPRILLGTQRDRLAADLANETPAAKRFLGTVNRFVDGSDVYGFQGWNAALVGQLTGDPKYCAAAVEKIDAEVKEAEAAIADGHAPFVAGDSYLQIGDRIGDLALVYDWCFDTVGDKRTRWLAYAQQAVTNVWDHENATWGGEKMPWSGWAVDDPSDNYYYSFLRATMLLGLAA